MTWEDEIPLIVRTLLQDVASPPAYSDDDVLKMAAIEAVKTQLRRPFLTRYTVDFDDSSITPDPAELQLDPASPTTTHDDAFVMIVSYASALAFIRTEIKTGMGRVKRIKDGRSELEWNRDAASAQAILDQYEGELEEVKDAYDAGRIRDVLGGIVSSHRFPPPLHSHWRYRCR